VPGQGVTVRLHPEVSGGFASLARLAWYVRTEMTGQVLTFWSIALSVSLYIIVSLLTCRTPFNLERMLHRGKWSHDGEQDEEAKESNPSWLERLGFDRNMTRWDRIVTAVTLAWPMFFTLVFFAGLLHYFLPGTSPFTDEQWATGWQIWLWFAIGVAVIVSGWFTIGGIRDLVRMFRRLESVRTDARDDGSVIDGVNADDLEGADGTGA
jgi:SSS family solute:Na+ symporter